MDKAIQILKNGILLPMQGLKHIEAPFSLVCTDGFEVKISYGDKPIYFGRNRMRISRGRCVAHFLYRYCIGVIHPDGVEEKHWISPEGTYLEINNEESKKVL